MSNNTFTWKRFLLLWKQHFIHHTNFLLLSTVAYIGVVFIVLSIVQTGNDFEPYDINAFQAFLIAFVAVFGFLYVGHSFPAFRSKEATISYLMVPASTLEKFTFEFLSRIGIMLVTLPLLYWVTFHLQGYVFTLFSDLPFQPIGIQHLVTIDVAPDYQVLIYMVTTAAVLLSLVLAFTGAAMFTKQPLVKSLFAIAVIVMFFMGYSYIMIEHVGLGEYHPPETMMLVPLEEAKALLVVSIALIISTALMLFVAFRKLKEREV